MDGLTYTYLSEILFSLKQRVPGGATVHWCACRSTDGSRREIEEQARGAWGGRL